MILGIDFGLKNIGLAISEGQIAQPKETIHVSSLPQAIKEIENRVQKWQIDKVVVGISEGKSRDQALAFGRRIESVLQLKVEYVDETLSSFEATNRKMTDKSKEHAKAAAIILQRYLDNLKLENGYS